jgi:hypothetical protein
MWRKLLIVRVTAKTGSAQYYTVEVFQDLGNDVKTLESLTASGVPANLGTPRIAFRNARRIF